MATVAVERSSRRSYRTEDPGNPSMNRVFPVHPVTGRTLPIHYWLRALQWSAVLMLAMAGIYLIERYVFGLAHHKHVDDVGRSMAQDPTALASIFFGMSHYTVATYFLLSSKKTRTVRGLVHLGLFTLLGAGLCYLVYLMGGQANKLAVIGVFIFFLLHGLRDEVSFYRQRAGQAITDEEYPHLFQMLMWVQALGFALATALLYPIFTYGLLFVKPQAQAQRFFDSIFPTYLPIALKMGLTSVPFLLFALLAVWRIQSRHPEGVIHLLRSHWPHTIIAGSYIVGAILVALLGLWVIHFIILMHFTGWFIFATAEIAKQPKEIQRTITWRTPNQWIRRNLVGFWIFHGGLALLFFSIIAFNHWVLAMKPVTVAGLEVSKALYLVGAKNLFYYLTVLHITLGLMPKAGLIRR